MNKNSLRQIELDSTNQTLLEERTILFEEIGLEEFENLESLSMI